MTATTSRMGPETLAVLAQIPSQHESQAAQTPHRFDIAPETIVQTCAGIPESARRMIKWAAEHCRSRKLSCAEFGALLRKPGTNDPYSGNSVYQVFTGRRDEGALDRFVEAVEIFRRRVEETTGRKTANFVETSLVRKIVRACDSARSRHRVTFIFGPSQIGKTTAIAHYAETHDETVVLRIPTGGSMSETLQELAIRLDIGTGRNIPELKRAIAESLDEHTLIIADECHQCLCGRGAAVRTLDYLRELQERRKCGLVMCGTDVFRLELRTNRILRQLWLRGYKPLTLPTIPSRDNLDQFAEHFGLRPAYDKTIAVEVEDSDTGKTNTIKGNPLELQTTVIEGYGLGRWIAILEDAQQLATERDANITWGCVIAAAEEFRIAEFSPSNN